MSFRTNSSQQMSMFDSTYGLTEREKKALDRSWARIFADDVFPQIDEKRFAVLYSDKASRPNTPVNVIVGALIIKELFGISDDEVVDNLMLDPRYQVALHTTSFEEQLAQRQESVPVPYPVATTTRRHMALICTTTVSPTLRKHPHE